jgi:hypothetical protein
MSPSRVRAAAKAGASPPVPRARSCAEAIKRSDGPGELGGRQPRLPLVRDAEGVDARPLCLGHREVRRNRVEHPVEAHRLPGLDAERDDVLDLEVDRAPDPDAVTEAVFFDLDSRTLDAGSSPMSGASPSIGPPFWPPKTAVSFSTCSSVARSST